MTDTQTPQPVAVEQRDIELAEQIIAIQFDNSHAAYRDDVAATIARHRLASTPQAASAIQMPTDQHGETASDRVRHHAVFGTMPRQLRKDLFALLELVATPSVAANAGEASPESPQAASAEVREALEQAHDLIQEAKGIAGPGSITDHLDFAEHWLNRVDAALAAVPAHAPIGDPDGWLAVKINDEGGIVMPYGPLHPHADAPNDPRYRWAPFYLGEPK